MYDVCAMFDYIICGWQHCEKNYVGNVRIILFLVTVPFGEIFLYSAKCEKVVSISRNGITL